MAKVKTKWIENNAITLQKLSDEGYTGVLYDRYGYPMATVTKGVIIDPTLKLRRLINGNNDPFINGNGDHYIVLS